MKSITDIVKHPEPALPQGVIDSLVGVVKSPESDFFSIISMLVVLNALPDTYSALSVPLGIILVAEAIVADILRRDTSSLTYDVLATPYRLLNSGYPQALARLFW